MVMFSGISVFSTLCAKRDDYLLYVNVMLPHAKGIKHFVFKTQTNFPTRTDLPSQQKNAHFHTYIRMGLYIRMCSSIRTYVVSCVT